MLAFIGARPRRVAAILLILIRWPGSPIGDNTLQLAEIRAGRLTDWHPPLMSVIWRAIGRTPQSILIFDGVVYWTGIAFLAEALGRLRGPRGAAFILLAALTPMSILYLGVA